MMDGGAIRVLETQKTLTFIATAGRNGHNSQSANHTAGCLLYPEPGNE